MIPNMVNFLDSAAITQRLLDRVQEACAFGAVGRFVRVAPQPHATAVSGDDVCDHCIRTVVSFDFLSVGCLRSPRPFCLSDLILHLPSISSVFAMSAAAPVKRDEKKENGAVVKKKVKQRRHHFLVSGTKFVCDTFYQPIKQVGTGAYGVVWCATSKLHFKICQNHTNFLRGF